MKFTTNALIFCAITSALAAGCRHSSHVTGLLPEATLIDGVVVGSEEQLEKLPSRWAGIAHNAVETELPAAGHEVLAKVVEPIQTQQAFADARISSGTRVFTHRDPIPLNAVSDSTVDSNVHGSIRPISFQKKSETVPPLEYDPADNLPIETASEAIMVELSLEELEQLAFRHNPTIRQAAAVFQKALGAAHQVNRYPNPTIGYSGQEIGDQGTAGIQGGFIQQTIVRGGKLKWNRRVADWDVQSQLWQVEAQRYRVRNDVRRHYFTVLAASKKLALMRDLEEIALDGAKNAQALNDAMEAAVPDVLQAEVQLSEVRILRKNTAVVHKAAWNQLANLIGRSGTAPQPLRDILESEQPERNAETAWEQLVSLSPQVRAASAEIQKARNQIEREKAQAVPNVNLQVGAVRVNTSGDDAANVTVGMPIPVFNRNKGNIDRATAEYQRAVWNRKRLLNDLQADLVATMSGYQQALTEANTFRDEIIPRETRTLKLIEAAYPTQFDFLRLLTTRRDYFKSRLAYLDALVRLRHAEVALDGLLLSGALDSPADSSLDASNRSNVFNNQ